MKNILAFSVLLGASIGLVACGDDDSSFNTVIAPDKPEDNVTEIAYSKIALGFSEGLAYSERSDIVLRDGQIQTTSKIFKGVNNSPNLSFPYTYIASNYYRAFEATDEEFKALISPTLKVLTPTSYSYTLDSLTNNKSLTLTPSLKAYDISGITTADEERFFTPLSLYELNNAQFPANSICYTESVEKVSFPVFKVGFAFFNENTIEEWLDQANAINSNQYDYEIVQVGEDNQHRAIRLVDPSNYKGEVGYEAAVEIDGSVYTADYIVDGYRQYTGADSSNVNCTYFNEVAADYLENQILIED